MFPDVVVVVVVVIVLLGVRRCSRGVWGGVGDLKRAVREANDREVFVEAGVPMYGGRPGVGGWAGGGRGFIKILRVGGQAYDKIRGWPRDGSLIVLPFCSR